MVERLRRVLGQSEIRVLLLLFGLLLAGLLVSVAHSKTSLTDSALPSVSSWDDLTKKYLSFREDNCALVVPGWFLVYGQIEAILNEYGLEELQKDPEWYWTFDGGTFVFEDDSPLARQVVSGTHIVIYEDSANEELLVLSEPEKEGGEYQEEIVCKAPAYPEQEKGTDYESYLYNELSKRRIAWKVVLKSRSAVEKEAVEEVALLTEEGEGGELLLRMTMEEGSNHLWVSIQGPAQGLSNMEIAAHIPDGFTNRIEIFTCTNLMDAWWTLAATNLSTEGTNMVYWVHDDPETLEQLYYTVGNADIDSDEDGLADARERFMYHTDPSNPDTDGDDAYDGDEVDAQTDPLNNPGDSDQDGLSDDLEVVLGTDPDEPDTDEDWVSDGYEVEKETDPLDIEDYPWLSLVINDGAAYAPSTTLEVSVPGLVADTLILSESPAMDNSTTGACAETVSYVLAHDTNGTRFVSAVAVRDGVTTGFTGSSSITLDTVPPSLQVDLPTNGFVTSARWIDVEGVVTDAVGNVGVKVDGDWADGIVRGAFWERRHPLSEGSNQLEVTAWDSAGHVVTQSLQVVQDLSQDTNAPTFSLNLPSDFTVQGGTTNWNYGVTTFGDEGSLSFCGSIDDETADIRIMVESTVGTNGPYHAGTGWETQFWGTVTLFEGTNGLVATAEDAAGNISTCTWTVVRDTSYMFRITSPLPDAVINDWSVQVTCVASPWFSNAEVTVNGRAATLTGCTTNAVFQTLEAVPLGEGVTKLSACAVLDGRSYYADPNGTPYEVSEWSASEQKEWVTKGFIPANWERAESGAGWQDYRGTWNASNQLAIACERWDWWERDWQGQQVGSADIFFYTNVSKMAPSTGMKCGYANWDWQTLEGSDSVKWTWDGLVRLGKVFTSSNAETVLLEFRAFDYGRNLGQPVEPTQVVFRGRSGFWYNGNVTFVTEIKRSEDLAISAEDFDYPSYASFVAGSSWWDKDVGRWMEFGSVTAKVLRVDMAASRPMTEGPEYGMPFGYHAVPESQEEDPGVGIRVNGDDDNGNSVADNTETTATNENDLIRVVLNATPPAASGFKYVLRRTSADIKVWTNQCKGNALLSANDETNLAFSTTPMTVWVENLNGGDADLELIAKADDVDVCSDRIHFYDFTAIAIVFGGAGQVPNDPPGRHEGVFMVATNLYELGYDVHMYLANAANETAAFNEIVAAIQNRDVVNVAILGYSWGGDSTHEVATRLNNERAQIGTFSLRYTAYVDAVEELSGPQENPPPGSACHDNYYQTRQYPHGVLIQSSRINVDVVTLDPAVTHAHGENDPPPDHSIDNNPTVRANIAAQLVSQISEP